MLYSCTRVYFLCFISYCAICFTSKRFDPDDILSILLKKPEPTRRNFCRRDRLWNDWRLNKTVQSSRVEIESSRGESVVMFEMMENRYKRTCCSTVTFVLFGKWIVVGLDSIRLLINRIIFWCWNSSDQSFEGRSTLIMSVGSPNMLFPFVSATLAAECGTWATYENNKQL